MDIIKSIEHEQIKASIPDLKIGNTVRVHVKIKEGNKERIQVFEGTIIKVQGAGVNKTFTVRKISYGVGVEKTFLIHSPLVEKVEVVRVGKARRAKLFYLRDRIGKAAKTKEKLGARIENKEITLKGEEIAENAETEEDVKAEEVTEVVENVEATEATEATPVVEETTVKEEITDTVDNATETAEETATTEEVAPVAEEASEEKEAPAENTNKDDSSAE